VRVVVDTNILVSGLISRTGPPARIVDAVLRGEIVPVMSDATFAELEEVLHRPSLQRYFRDSRVTPFQLLTALKTVAEFAKPGHSRVRMRDPTDRPFADLAAAHPAPDFIVTRARTEFWPGAPTSISKLNLPPIFHYEAGLFFAR